MCHKPHKRGRPAGTRYSLRLIDRDTETPATRWLRIPAKWASRTLRVEVRVTNPRGSTMDLDPTRSGLGTRVGGG
jgi:hypothetical protein